MAVRSGLVCLATLVLAACGAAYQVEADYDDQATFGNYRTWAWISDNPLISTDGVDAASVGNPLWENRIKFHVEKGLAAKGYRLIGQPEQADFVASFTLGARDKIKVNSYPEPYHGGWGRGWGYGYYGYPSTDVDVRHYTEGTLAIDIFDVRSRRPVWHGYATGNVRKNRDREEREALLQEVVSSILNRFPPA